MEVAKTQTRKARGAFEEHTGSAGGEMLIRLDAGERGKAGRMAAVRRRDGHVVGKRTGVRLEADAGTGELWTTVTVGTFADG